MKKDIAITTTLKGEWEKGEASSEKLQAGLKRVLRVLISLSYNLLGFAGLLVLWQLVSMITKGELPGPVATSSVFWALISDPFYDYGPNDKGIALQLFSSLIR